MKYIKKLVDEIDEEICGAKEYAEMYVDHKSRGNGSWASRFKQMSNDELSHAMTLHDYAVEEIGRISSVFKAPAEMQEAWDKSHVAYVEKVAWVKQMLSM